MIHNKMWIELSFSVAAIALVWKYYTTITCEDSYQAQRGKLHTKNKPYVAIRAIYPSREDVVEEAMLRQKIERVNSHLGKMRSYRIVPSIFTSIEEYQACESHIKILLKNDENVLYAHADHRYIGGSTLAWTTFLVNKKIQKDYFYNSRWWHLFPAIKLWWNRQHIPRVPQPLALFSDDDQILRYVYSYSFRREKSVKATLLYDTMKDLYACLKLDRKMVCYLPIAFNPTETIYNNVGILWLTYEPSDTVESIQRQLQQNAYQVLATNFVLCRGWNNKKGSDVRQSVDAVITIIFSEDDINIKKSWTFYNVPDYPVYVAINSILSEKNEINVTRTLTVSTPSFDIGESELPYEETRREDYAL